VADQDPMNSPHLAAERVIRLLNGCWTMAIVAEFRHARAQTARLGSENGTDAAQDPDSLPRLPRRYPRAPAHSTA
jgi:hypothetical protein